MNWAQSTWKKHTAFTETLQDQRLWSRAAGRQHLSSCAPTQRHLTFTWSFPSLALIWGWFYLISCWTFTRIFASLLWVPDLFVCLSSRSGECTGVGSSLSRSQAQVPPFKLPLTKPVSTYGGLRDTVKQKKPVVPCKMKPGFPHLCFLRERLQNPWKLPFSTE